MAEISKPSNLSLTWASGGDILDPGDTKYSTGWQVEIPPRQWFNYLDNRQDEAIAHINQHGVAVWDSSTEYQSNKSYVQGTDGKLYVCVQTHTNQNPTTDVAEVYWSPLFNNRLVSFSTAGVSSWTVPAILKSGVKKAKVYVIGGGGAGGGASSSANYNAAGGGGGAGGCAIEYVDLTGVTSVSITVGAGGVGLASGVSPGTSGGTSSFGAYCSATGGVFGNPANASASSSQIGAGSDGGVGTGGDMNLRGGGGQGGDSANPTIVGGTVGGGIGGDSIFSSGVRGAAPTHGAGGSGAATSVGGQVIAGQNGSAGIVVIEY